MCGGGINGRRAPPPPPPVPVGCPRPTVSVPLSGRDQHRSILLAAQFSNNVIRLYEVIPIDEGSIGDSYATGVDLDQTKLPSFLRPLHILSAHRTGNHWPISLSIYMGSDYRLNIPSTDYEDHQRRRVLSGSGPGLLPGGVVSPPLSGVGMGSGVFSGYREGEGLPTVQKVRAVDAADRGSTFKESLSILSTASSREHTSTGEQPRQE